MYVKIYSRLCALGRQAVSSYGYGSDLHRHHILPVHMGGKDEDINYTYLTVREHIIAHFLLWKIHKNPNDLRSMKMLGAKLTVKQRKIIGKFCVKNKIGVHGYSKEKKSQIGQKTFKKMKQQYVETGTKNFYYWASETGRKERASMGGKASAAKDPDMWKRMRKGKSKEEIREFCRQGSLNAPKQPATNGKENRKFYTKKERRAFIESNPGWRCGMTQFQRKKGYSNPKIRKKVSDGQLVYESITEAAKAANVTCGAICFRCKSKKSPWHYV